MTLFDDRKKKVNWTLTQKSISVLECLKEEYRKKTGNKKMSMSCFIDYLLGSIEDPITRKKQEARKLAVQLNQLQSEIAALEDHSKIVLECTE